MARVPGRAGATERAGAAAVSDAALRHGGTAPKAERASGLALRPSKSRKVSAMLRLFSSFAALTDGT
jgi:hypothetical protein